MAKSFKKFVSDGIQSIDSKAGSLKEKTSSTAASLKDKASDTLFPTLLAPAYLLHSSAKADDYEVHIDIEQVIYQLNTGVLCRPKIQLFAGRGDIDRTHMADRVCEAFSQAMEGHERDMKALIESETNKNRTALESTTENLGQDVADLALIGAATAATGGLALLFVADVGVDKVGRVATGISSLPGQILSAGKESITGGAQAKLSERELSSSLNRVKKALAEQTLTIHNDLVRLSSSFDNVVYPMSGDRPRAKDELPAEIIERITEIAGQYLYSNY